MSKYDLKNIIKLGKKFNFKFACLPSNYLKLLKNLINKSIKIKKIVSAASSLANKDKKILLKKK